ncbi:TetR/AcrR family transcriptional regulator [Planomonospora venezuelensis]|uniref:AcrR family transcriptional regulator n=1 Tax=Planomonospora venezuelensis TaxID=1999 RepID=A0A841CXD9_PLAVE|nr:TetR/AcrR family transcriptional regulator [Planomonospora venezuelensis]MBB5962601.1 AcrR family transcriptional regulator [Planomonospora venezuelensis]GIM98350.1 TetR family transcriptional regulator [Planomonospora venezuelensis]
MCSAHDDLTARAVIRDRALELFAAQGPDAVTVRRIAAAAGVSPGLVIHHFGSKERLRAAVDEHVAGVFDDLFTRAATGGLDMTDGASLAEAFLRQLPPGSPVPGYLRRLLLTGDAAGTGIFRRWFTAGRTMTEALVARGLLGPGRDPEVRTAFLMVNDLVLLLLRDQLAEVVGIDPLGPEGAVRWAEEVLDIYRNGLFGTEGESAS